MVMIWFESMWSVIEMIVIVRHGVREQGIRSEVWNIIDFSSCLFLVCDVCSGIGLLAMHILIFISRHGIEPIKSIRETESLSHRCCIVATFKTYQKEGVTPDSPLASHQGMEARVVWAEAGPGPVTGPERPGWGSGSLCRPGCISQLRGSSPGPGLFPSSQYSQYSHQYSQPCPD